MERPLLNGVLNSLGERRKTYSSDVVSLQRAYNGDWRTEVGPKSVTALTGIQYDEDGNPVGSGSPYQPYVSPTKGLRCSGAWTNLFTNITPTAETKSLTAQKYCLQVFGTGASATCSYGTATESTPLIFTATAGSTTFTPTSCAKWMLVADGGYVRDYIPPGITNSASSSTTGGGGTNTPLSDDMLECLRGKVDGVEKVTNGDFSGVFTTGLATNWSSPRGNVAEVPGVLGSAQSVTNIAGNTGVVYQNISATIGARYLVSFVAKKISGTGGIVSDIATSGTLLSVAIENSSWERFTKEITATNSTIGFGAYANLSAVSGANGVAIDNISIQRLLPSVFTAVAVVHVGAGSGELPNSTTALIATVNSTTEAGIITRVVNQTSRIPARGYDGLTYANSILDQAWNRDEIHLKCVQTNAAGTQFRAGNRRYTAAMVPIDALTWGSWAAYVGSFSPLTHLRLALNGTIPLGFLLTSLSGKSLSDADILKQLRYIK